VVAALGRLDRAPVDRQPQEVEAERAHPGAILWCERGDRLERRAAVGERHVEHAGDPRVDPAEQRDPTLVVAQVRAVRGQRRRGGRRAAARDETDQDREPHAIEGRLAAMAAKGDLSVTALYTSGVWTWGGLSYAHLYATTDAKRVFDATNAAL